MKSDGPLRALAIALALLMAASVSACGKKGRLQHPEDSKSTYPRSYPTS